MDEIQVIKIYIWDNFVGALTWNKDRGYSEFQFDEDFPRLGLDIAPLTMPISRWRVPFSFPSHAGTNCFRGLPGIIADCLPDKFGSQLINEWFAQKVKTESFITPLDRLCYVGKRTMGALEFIPSEHIAGVEESTQVYIRELMNVSETLFKERDNFQTLLRQENKSILDILKVGISAGGAKPKAIIAYNETTGEVRCGQIKAPEGFSYWLLKFDGGTYSEHNEITDNPQGIGNIEYAYYKMACKCGITMTESRLFDEGDCHHFMTKRFDRTDSGEKIHMLTAAGLAHFDRDARHSYEELFGILRRMNFTASDAEQLFRRMVFNVETRNNDDHTKNFSFLMDRNGSWSLAPAYDLCYSYNPEGKWTAHHQMSLNGKQADFTKDDLLSVAKNVGVRRANEIVDEITNVIREWNDIAKDCGVRDNHREQIAKQLLLF